MDKDAKFSKLIPARFIRDAIRNGYTRDVADSKERNRRSDWEAKNWIGNPQYGKYSMLMGFTKKCRQEYV